MLENYNKAVTIEANTMIEMAKTQIVPAIESFTADVAGSAATKKTLNNKLACKYETELVSKLSELTDEIYGKIGELEKAVAGLSKAKDTIKESELIRDKVLPKMAELRKPVDEAETVTAKDYWPYPSYGDLLFGVK